MNYMTIKPVDVANGPGVRVSLFVSGCSHHCPGCFNAEAWDYDAGELFTLETAQEIMELCDKPQIAGLSILGGEPLDRKNLHDVTVLAAVFKNRFPDKDLWVYTGYRYEGVEMLHIMKYIDTLVDGPFVEAQKDLSLRFRGSRNQRIIDVQLSRQARWPVLRKDLME